MNKPQTLPDLFRFYFEFIKPLYAAVQAENELPHEILFEINAAFDHISRHWTYNEPEAQVVEKAYSHLKRSALDVFKIFVKNTVDKYGELQKIDTSLIDNGEFDKQMHLLISEMKKEASDARCAEGVPSNNHVDEAFDRWISVLQKCQRFEREFFLSPHLPWAQRKARIFNTKSFILAIVASLIAGVLISPAVLGFFRWLMSFAIPLQQ